MQETVFNREIEKLLQNPDFLVKLINSDNLNDIKKLFEKEGTMVTNKDLEAVFGFIDNIINLNKNGKLNDDALENISGGSVTITILTVVAMLTGAGGYGYQVLTKSKTNTLKKETEALGNNVEINKLISDLEIARKEKDFEKYKTDKKFFLGATAISLASALTLINYYKKDIYKFWNTKKDAWFKENKDVRNNR